MGTNSPNQGATLGQICSDLLDNPPVIQSHEMNDALINQKNVLYELPTVRQGSQKCKLGLRQRVHCLSKMIVNNYPQKVPTTRIYFPTFQRISNLHFVYSHYSYFLSCL
jgi:hypothetical protein